MYPGVKKREKKEKKEKNGKKFNASPGAHGFIHSGCPLRKKIKKGEKKSCKYLQRHLVPRVFPGEKKKLSYTYLTRLRVPRGTSIRGVGRGKKRNKKPYLTRLRLFLEVKYLQKFNAVCAVYSMSQRRVRYPQLFGQLQKLNASPGTLRGPSILKVPNTYMGGPRGPLFHQFGELKKTFQKFRV